MFKIAMTLAAIHVIAFMSDLCETVIIEGSDGNPLRINAEDFDKKLHKLHGANEEPQADPVVAGSPPVLAEGVIVAPAPSAPDLTVPPVDPNDPAAVAAAAGTPVAPVTPAPNAKLVKKEGKKFFVVDAGGEKITDAEGIDVAGYATEADAWAAVMASPR
jgi:hypothetical protein